VVDRSLPGYFKNSEVAKKNRSSASGSKAVNQGASTSYVYAVDCFLPGYFKNSEIAKKNRPSASGSRAVNQGASTTYIYVA
jgi:hypothetical protein